MLFHSGELESSISECAGLCYIQAVILFTSLFLFLIFGWDFQKHFSDLEVRVLLNFTLKISKVKDKR